MFVSLSTLSFCALLFACLYVSASACLCSSLFTCLHAYLPDSDSSLHVRVRGGTSGLFNLTQRLVFVHSKWFQELTQAFWSFLWWFLKYFNFLPKNWHFLQHLRPQIKCIQPVLLSHTSCKQNFNTISNPILMKCPEVLWRISPNLKVRCLKHGFCAGPT